MFVKTHYDFVILIVVLYSNRKIKELLSAGDLIGDKHTFCQENLKSNAAEVESQKQPERELSNFSLNIVNFGEQ
jgi:hypothetical protein